MVIENTLPSFSEWIGLALLIWCGVVLVVSLLGIGAGFLVAALRHGFGTALGMTAGVLRQGVEDVVRMSPRRVFALAWLAVKESIRRRVLVVFVVFLAILLFAGWFLDPHSLDPARLYIGFVLTTTSYLVLLLVLFLSALSLPADIQSRTLHTVVTKPVRASEVVLGRMLGFTAIGTALLVVMGLVSYGFVVRGLAHVHTLQAADLTGAQEGAADSQTGYTSQNRSHRHKVSVDGYGKVEVEPTLGHTHTITLSHSGNYQVGSAEGALVARVPVYGQMRFRERTGLDEKVGINVGDEWFYRSYIAGGSQAAVIWTFEGITPGKFPESLPVEMGISVFRTHKGNIEKGVFGSLSLRNPKTGLTVEVDIFESKEFSSQLRSLPRTITNFSSARIIPQRYIGDDGKEVTIPAANEVQPELAEKKAFDLFEDLVADGKVEIWLRCLEPSQYFGAAQADLYLRAHDASFFVNFAKGYLGIWYQMVLVIGFGVMFSTFLSGPVAMIATLGTLVGGIFINFMFDLAVGRTYGGGSLESFVRMVTQQNLTTELNPGLQTDVIKMADVVLRGGLLLFTGVLPPLGQFNASDYVSSGFDISGTWVLIRFLSVLGYLLPVFLVGYFFLKTREVAR